MDVQAKLFYDTIADAISDGVLAAGGWKVVAGKLWPAMKPSSAYARLKSCVSEDKDEKLSPDEVLLIAKLAKEQGNHAIIQFLAQELGYEVKEVQPRDELQSLLHESAELTKQVAARQQRIERLLELSTVTQLRR